VDGQFTKSSSGYVEVDDCELQVTGNVLISGSGITTIIGNKINNLVVNNAGASVLVKGADDCVMPQVTAGTLNIVDSIIRASTNTANAVTASAGTVVTLMNNQIVTPTADNVARVSIAGYHSIISVVYDKPNSTLSNSLNSVVYFQTVNVDSLVSTGNVTAAQYNFANGVNILSTVGAGSYSNTQVASYLLHFDGDIEFTSSTAKIGNVDVITVGDHIRSPAYQFSNGTSIFDGITGTYSNTNVAAYLTTGVTTANLTATGNVVQQSAYYERYGNISNSGGNLTCNFNLGTTFYAALTANVTANFTNVNAIASTVSGATIIVDQGATAYRIANVQVNGVNQTVRWVGAVAGAGTASNTDIVSFSLIHLGGGAYRVLGQQSSYG
jgi:hypothetical protein